MNFDLKNITYGQSLVVTFILLGAISPGILIIYMYKPELVLQLGALKLVLFSLALTLPVVIINSMGVLASAEEEHERHFITLYGLYASAVVMYIAIGVTYFQGYSFTQFVMLLGGFQAFMCLIYFFDHRKNVKKRKEKEPLSLVLEEE